MSQIAIVHFVNYKKGTQSRAAMRGVMLYVMQTKKTEWEGERLISGINCQPESVCDDFLNTKLLYHKDKGVLFYHMVQSFPKGAEINPRDIYKTLKFITELGTAMDISTAWSGSAMTGICSSWCLALQSLSLRHLMKN